ncbi:MAG: DUF881 domain-containing protein [Syntrophomonas sp.]|nr:DUF881 domain-containing protein [Syntrophomonas sp.]
MHNKNGKITIMTICMVVGIMLAIQFKTSSTYDVSYRGTRSDEMAYKISTISKERDAYSKEVVDLRQKLTNLENGSGEAIADLQSELKKANVSAGLTPIEGPGIIVTINDSPKLVRLDVDVNNYLVHDYDIQSIVNEMRASGAEAISVNEQRITAMSEIRCAGTTILVNQNRITPPFVIKATGDPKNLDTGLSMPGGILDRLTGFLQIKLERAEKIEIAAYNGVLKLNYSYPISTK